MDTVHGVSGVKDLLLLFCANSTKRLPMERAAPFTPLNSSSTTPTLALSWQSNPPTTTVILNVASWGPVDTVHGVSGVKDLLLLLFRVPIHSRHSRAMPKTLLRGEGLHYFSAISALCCLS